MSEQALAPDTGAFQALAEEVAQLREELRIFRSHAELFRSLGHAEAILDRADEDRARRERRAARARPSYLRPVDGSAS